MSLESIKKLRKSADEISELATPCGASPDWMGVRRKIDALADAIEQEVAERYVPLPTDADGVPIHLGDVMEFSHFDIKHPVVRTVDGIGKDVFFAWCGERGYQQHDAKRYRHHQPDSWERIIEDAVKMGVYDHDNEHVKEKLIARCRALAGDD